MLSIPPVKFPRRRHRRPRPTTAQASPAALNLVAASFDVGEAQVTLTFDRAIDIASLHGTAITIDDGEASNTRYDASGGAALITPTSVRIDVSAIGTFSDAGTFLNASASNGIVAVDDGGTWAGCANVELPFP